MISMAEQSQQQRIETVALPISQQEATKRNVKASLSCIPSIDALWFCYSPVYQMKQYYRQGEFDSCTGRWSDLFHCISLKTKPAAEVEVILGERQAVQEKEHLWKFRSREEATEFWKEQFGQQVE